jgi:recombination protein RecT
MAVNNSLVQRQGGGKPQTFSAFLTSDAIKNRINSMVGSKDGQRFISAVISAVSVNPGIAECDHATILSAALLGESLKLSPSPQLGQYYLVPFNDKKRGTKVAQFQLGYKGYIQLAIRSGQYKKLNVLAIKEGELVSYDPLDESIQVNLIQDDTAREAAKTIGYYAMFEYTNGFKKAMYWSREKMMAHADKYSMAFSASKYQDLLDGKIPQSEMWKYSSFWYKDFDGMAYKTMLRQLISKWGIMSIDLQNAIDKDMAAIHEDGTVDYVDNSVDYAPDNGPAPVPVDQATGEVIEAADEDPTAGFFNQ